MSFCNKFYLLLQCIIDVFENLRFNLLYITSPFNLANYFEMGAKIPLPIKGEKNFRVKN